MIFIRLVFLWEVMSKIIRTLWLFMGIAGFYVIDIDEAVRIFGYIGCCYVSIAVQECDNLLLAWWWLYNAKIVYGVFKRETYCRLVIKISLKRHLYFLRNRKIRTIYRAIHNAIAYLRWGEKHSFLPQRDARWNVIGK